MSAPLLPDQPSFPTAVRSVPYPVDSRNSKARSAVLEPQPDQERSHQFEAPALSATDPKVSWLIWQIADSAFPTGGFAHSNGMEAAWYQGEIRSPEELAGFIQVQLAQTGRAALPFVNEAYCESRRFADVDWLYDAFNSNHVNNRASRAQGQALLLAASQSFDLPSLPAFRTSVLGEKLPGHLPPVFGTVMRFLRISHAACVRLYLFMQLRGLIASAVRLSILGPLAAQSLQARIAGSAEDIALRNATARITDAAQISPLLDILHGAHDRLYSRLFQT